MYRVKVGNNTVVEFDDSAANLLQALERHQLQVNFQCREGYCGACRCKLNSGEIRYLHEPLAFVRQGEFLPCCSIPLTNIDIEIP
ncbi:class I ribonucleotide reductase maintenance protein YfaE [Rheinheimera muenzenbergensis]|uniref:Class I ribonucleotide reductase maintenance protein YfaE n=1 Tax=Rheinheimera muenzenbergensis TaxID=1193628 RepID=A0ABU8C887_9GAMM|nr:2Fe-2S ferredoxin-like protein [Gammaproteobacteria bacterium]MBU1553851.1 2Fe-2S ferredoxin-like protein [Gammaproteobacteria bacterium]MBU2068841.1 2Fe-2S ferredoxin-like protein [Gammaproteobacteria bacterium]MBU2184996.1 2Fe-2S ferredoxin-like protein [Gammaproteobacteria bacterium]MBU2203722.1 2Fe-2S ferredoxin-like protein [Gammaproteobacteria bacterium]